MLTLPFIIQLRFLLCGSPFQPLILLLQSCWVLLEHMVLKLTRVLSNLLGGRLQPTTFFYHALGLLALGILSKVLPHFPIKLSFLLIQIGILFFCGSLLHHGARFTTNIRCNYANRWSLNDCGMASLGLECFQIRKIIGM